MRRCIDLAHNGENHVAPNPMVGALIVYKDKIIGEGYHRSFGEAHAEVNAINSVKHKELLPESTIYVSLEPCSHQGKTPPCSDLIIRNKIKKVVIGSVDPNSLVAGKGIEKLKNAGTEVVVGVLEEDCKILNKRFFTFHKAKRPYIILKWAESADGFMDPERNENAPVGPNWISNPISRKLVHKWRAIEQGILVGTNTVLADNPGLDTRLWPGKSPTRIILDRTLRIPNQLKIYNGKSPTIVYNEIKNMETDQLSFKKIEFNNHQLISILKDLYTQNIQSILVEGGSQVLQSFIDNQLWDEARVFKGTNYFHSGIKAPSLSFSTFKVTQVLEDKLFLYYPRYPKN